MRGKAHEKMVGLVSGFAAGALLATVGFYVYYLFLV